MTTTKKFLSYVGLALFAVFITWAFIKDAESTQKKRDAASRFCIQNGGTALMEFSSSVGDLQFTGCTYKADVERP